MAILKTVKADSKAGHKLLERLEKRGQGLLDPATLQKAERIVQSVRRGGDKALVKMARRYDNVAAENAEQLRLVPERTDRRELPCGFEHALERAIAAVERYHERQTHDGFRSSEGGIELEERRTPLRRVGVYIPGGRAIYPSSVVMTVVPALLAGVEEIVVTTPAASFHASAALRHVLERLRVTEIWGVGGAQAIAALAYGTQSIPRVDKIVGPGNVWVTAAKRLVSMDVAIDGLAGPSEVLIVASGDVDPQLLAADLLAQAEHDPQATAMLLTDRPKLGRQLTRELKNQLADLPTAKVATTSLAAHGACVVVPDMEVALDWIERIAPEHLELVGTDAEALVDRVTSAGAIFVGPSTPEVFGDYLAGPSHVLPTAGTARFASALGVEDFIRRSHVIRFTPDAASRCAAAAAVLADVEGLPAHAASARLRATYSSKED